MLSFGNPMKSRNMLTGNGLAKLSTKSHSPMAAHLAASSRANSRTLASSCLMRAGEKMGFMMERNFGCCGGSSSRGIRLRPELDRMILLEKVAAS